MAAAAPYVGLAKKLARQCYASGIRAKSYLVAAGTTIRVENYPESYLSKVFIRSAPAGYPFLAVTWEPEGIVLTPRTEAVPYGYGFPKRSLGALNGAGNERYFEGGEKINPPFGTQIEDEDDECLNQVLINRFENNKYLDKIEHIVGLPGEEKGIFSLPLENRRLRDSIESEYDSTGYEKAKEKSTVVYWPLFYFPPTEDGDLTFWTESEDGFKWHDAPGVDKSNRGLYRPIKLLTEEEDETKPLYRQFEIEENGLSTVFSTKLIYEEESEDWFCHWPEELLYDNDGYEMLFYMTNQYRSEVGRLPLFREIRGHANEARMILAECQRAKVMYHDSEEFYRQGYQTVAERSYNAGANFTGTGENLLISSTLGGLSLADGEIAADLWRNSPPHYTNMIRALWEDPLNSTSHVITGSVLGTATETQYGGEFDPPLSGAFWSQLFVRRQYWIMAGNINQTTRHGSVSFFWNTSPLGLGYSLGGSKEFYLYFKGREVLVDPFIEKYNEGFVVNMKGAAICKIGGMFYVRVIFVALLPPSTQNYYVYRRPLFGNHIEDWTEEAVVAVENFMLQYSIASFDYEGERAILTRMFVDTEDTASYYFPLASNQFVAMSSSQSFLEYYDGAFSVVKTSLGPEITYIVETTDDYISRYLQKCESTDGVEVNPFYVYNEQRSSTELKYLLVKYDWEIDQTRAGSVYQNDWYITETLVLPSGKEIVLKNASASSSGDKTRMVLAENSYVLIFLYIDPVNEDMVYVKINLRGDGTAVYGQATIYADLYDSEEPLVIASFAEMLLNSTSLNHPELVSSSISSPSPSSICAGIIHPAPAFQRDATGNLFPIFQQVDLQYKCTSYSGTLRALTQKPLTGIHSARLDMNFGDYSNCIYFGDLGLMNFTYAAGLKVADYEVDGVGCYAARYKDKFVAQINIDLSQSLKMWNIPFTEEKTVWANFALDELVGMGSLTDVWPMGAIL